MKCKFCGNEIPNDAVFCPVCGGDLSQSRRCVNCGEIIENDAAFCPFCGAAQPQEQMGQGQANASQGGVGIDAGGTAPGYDASGQNAPGAYNAQPLGMTPQEKKRDNKIYWIAGGAGFLLLVVAVLLIVFRADIFGGHDIIDRHDDISYMPTETVDSSTPNVTYTHSDAPNSLEELGSEVSERRLTESDIYGLSSAELRILRNYIYAHHGYIFKSRDLREYFNGLSWYTGYNASEGSVYSEFNSVEVANVAFLKRHE